MGLVQPIEAWAASTPDSVALRLEGKNITYKELNCRANRVANGLRGLGIKERDRVAIMLPNIPEYSQRLRRQMRRCLDQFRSHDQ